MELENLMSAFAEKLGIEGVEVKDGTCSLTIDDIPMDFTESPDGLAVVGAAVIGEPPPAKREAFYEMLLNATWKQKPPWKCSRRFMRSRTARRSPRSRRRFCKG